MLLWKSKHEETGGNCFLHFRKTDIRRGKGGFRDEKGVEEGERWSEVILEEANFHLKTESRSTDAGNPRKRGNSFGAQHLLDRVTELNLKLW